MLEDVGRIDGGFITSRLAAFGAALVTPVLLEFGALKWVLERFLAALTKIPRDSLGSRAMTGISILRVLGYIQYYYVGTVKVRSYASCRPPYQSQKPCRLRAGASFRSRSPESGWR